MSPQAKRTIDDLAKWLPMAGWGVALYFLMDIHGDIKTMSEKLDGVKEVVGVHDYHLSVHDSQISDLQRRARYTPNTD